MHLGDFNDPSYHAISSMLLCSTNGGTHDALTRLSLYSIRATMSLCGSLNVMDGMLDMALTALYGTRTDRLCIIALPNVVRLKIHILCYPSLSSCADDIQRRHILSGVRELSLVRDGDGGNFPMDILQVALVALIQCLPSVETICLPYLGRSSCNVLPVIKNVVASLKQSHEHGEPTTPIKLVVSPKTTIDTGYVSGYMWCDQLYMASTIPDTLSTKSEAVEWSIRQQRDYKTPRIVLDGVEGLRMFVNSIAPMQLTVYQAHAAISLSSSVAHVTRGIWPAHLKLLILQGIHLDAVEYLKHDHLPNLISLQLNIQHNDDDNVSSYNDPWLLQQFMAQWPRGLKEIRLSYRKCFTGGFIIEVDESQRIAFPNLESFGTTDGDSNTPISNIVQFLSLRTILQQWPKLNSFTAVGRIDVCCHESSWIGSDPANTIPPWILRGSIVDVMGSDELASGLTFADHDPHDWPQTVHLCNLVVRTTIHPLLSPTQYRHAVGWIEGQLNGASCTHSSCVITRPWRDAFGVSIPSAYIKNDGKCTK